MSTYAEKLEQLQRMRSELRAFERQAEAEAKRMQPLTEADERQMLGMQARADEAYVAAARRAPPPHAYERPDEYRRRLVDGVKGYSPKWRQVDIARMDDSVLPIAEKQIYADAVANGRTYELKPGEIRERLTESGGGHKVIEFDGGEDTHFTEQFRRPPRFGQLKSQAEYAQMSRDANAARIDQIIRGYQRPIFRRRAPRFDLEFERASFAIGTGATTPLSLAPQLAVIGDDTDDGSGGERPSGKRKISPGK